MSILKIGLMWFPVMTLGYGKRVGIWFQGCKKNCANCISPEFQSQSDGEERNIKEIIEKIMSYSEIDGLTISGGEPFDQPEGLLKLVQMYKHHVNDDILIFTGYTLNELKEKKSPVIEEVLKNIAVLVDGTYIDEKNDGIGMRGSSNQKIHVWKCRERYEDAETFARKMQCVLLKDRLWMIGIPPK